MDASEMRELKDEVLKLCSGFRERIAQLEKENVKLSARIDQEAVTIGGVKPTVWLGLRRTLRQEISRNGMTLSPCWSRTLTHRDNSKVWRRRNINLRR
jgi:hypothetical protein